MYHKGLSLKCTLNCDISHILAIIKDNEYSAMCSTKMLNEGNLGTFLMMTEEGTQSQAFTVYSNEKIIGIAAISNIHPVKRSCLIRFLIIDKSVRHVGYGLRVAAMLMRYCFDNLNLERVYARTWSDNNNMDSVYKAGNFRLEGTEKKESFVNGQWVDRKLWAVLRSEFDFVKMNKILGG